MNSFNLTLSEKHLQKKNGRADKDFLYLFLERGGKGEREGEKHQYVVASYAPPTGDLAQNPGMCPGPH